MDKPLLSSLNRADGSASCSRNGYSVVCAINGPVEVQRREEMPEEAVVDVVIRPAYGIGSLSISKAKARLDVNEDRRRERKAP